MIWLNSPLGPILGNYLLQFTDVFAVADKISWQTIFTGQTLVRWRDRHTVILVHLPSIYTSGLFKALLGFPHLETSDTLCKYMGNVRN